MRFEHEVRPETGDDVESEGVEAVAAYLLERGLAADDPESARMFIRLLTLPRTHCRRVSVTCAARTFYLSRRSLGRWCRRSGLPVASHILTFGRIAHTIHLARTHDMTLTAAAMQTSWSDVFAMSNTTHRLTGIRPSVAKERGLVYLAEAWLQREIRAGRAELREPRPPCCPTCGQRVHVTEGEAKGDELRVS